MGNSINNKNEDKQTTLHSQNIHNPINEVSSAIDVHCLSSDITLHQNEQQNQYSAARLFEPFRDLLSDLINQNKQLREEINQIKKHSQLQFNEYSEKKAMPELRPKINRISALILIVGLLLGLIFGHNLAATSNEQLKKNEELLLGIEQLKKQIQLQLNEQSKKNEELLLEIDQLKKQGELQLTGQLRKNEELQLAINQLDEKSANHTIDINKLQTDNQNQNIEVQEIDQRHNLLEMNVNTLRDKVKHLLKYRAANGRKLMIDAKCSQKLGQFIGRNNEVILKELVEKRREQCELTVSNSTNSRHLNRLTYRHDQPSVTLA